MTSLIEADIEQIDAWRPTAPLDVTEATTTDVWS